MQTITTPPSVSVVIPNFNGRDLLEQNLPRLISTLDSLSATTEIIVVDDASTDDSVKFLGTNFPTVRVLLKPVNTGFAETCNLGVEHARGKYVYLLNSDINVEPGFLDSLIPHFQDEKVFAVSSKEINDGKTVPQDYFPYPCRQWGLFYFVYRQVKLGVNKPAYPVFFVSGGRTLYDKTKFISLSGFTPMYRPFYWEDVDICYRAWQNGWQSLYDPRSLVRHRCKQTIGKFYTSPQVRNIYWKNRFLFIWRNYDSVVDWLIHLAFLPVLLVLTTFTGQHYFRRGFSLACRQIKEMVRKYKPAILSRTPKRNRFAVWYSFWKCNINHRVH